MLKTNEVIKVLNAHNFVLVRSNKHLIYSNGSFTVAVPHGRVCSRGLIRRLLTQAGLEKSLIKSIIG